MDRKDESAYTDDRIPEGNESGSRHNKILEDMTSSPTKAASPLAKPEENANMNSISAYGNSENPSFAQIDSYTIPQPQLYSQYETGRRSCYYAHSTKGKEIDPGEGPSGMNKEDSMDTDSMDGDSSMGSPWREPSEEDSFDPALYYSKDMFEDPWEGLTPVIWPGLPPPET